MNQSHIFYPCLFLILHTGLILLRMLSLRVMCVKNKEVDARYYKTYDIESGEPKINVQTSRNFSNLFEAPTLFYVVCAFCLITRNVDSIMLALAWLYVAFRLIHSLIHITTNKIYPRMATYGFSWIVLVSMAIRLGLKISWSKDYYLYSV